MATRLTHLNLVKAQRETQTKTDTILVTHKLLQEWKMPPFQRELRVNAKVIALAEEMKETGGVFPGVLTIGVLKGHKYLVDGQHRVEAFKMSNLSEGFSDVRYRVYESMADMAEDFVLLNSSLVRMRPDDILRGLEGSSEALRLVRQRCPVVGYDQIRRNSTNAPILGMSSLLRCWTAASQAVPTRGGQGSATDQAKSFTLDEAERVCDFIVIALRAWGRDEEYARLWSTLNLTLCMWLFRNLVLFPYSSRTPKISKDLFCKCLQSISTSPDYLDWLLGRSLSDRDRSPAYRRIKSAFTKRIEHETGKKVKLPAPEWAHGS